MTALTMRFSAAVGRTLRPGDEIVCTRLDHDANVRPWLIAAERAGATRALRRARARHARAARQRRRGGAVGPHALDRGHRRLQRGRHGARPARDRRRRAPRRRARLRRRRPRVPAPAARRGRRSASTRWPARPTSGSGRTSACSARARSCSRSCTPDKLRPSSDGAPERWELGTLPFEALAGVRAAAEYVVSLDWGDVRAHEDALLGRARSTACGAIDGVTLYGDAPRPHADADVQRRRARRRARSRPRSPSARSRSGTATTTRGSSSATSASRPHGAVRAGFVHYNDDGDARAAARRRPRRSLSGSRGGCGARRGARRAPSPRRRGCGARGSTRPTVQTKATKNPPALRPPLSA